MYLPENIYYTFKIVIHVNLLKSSVSKTILFHNHGAGFIPNNTCLQRRGLIYKYFRFVIQF